MVNAVINLKNGDPLIVKFDDVKHAKDQILYSVREYNGIWSDEAQIWVPNAEITSIQVEVPASHDRPSPDPEKVKARHDRLANQAENGAVANAPLIENLSDQSMAIEHKPHNLRKKGVLAHEDAVS